jgi:ElaB/YqjD/DUF883 family membrane-anchored ribosome-binding protein
VDQKGCIVDPSSAINIISGLTGVVGTIAAVIGFTYKRGGEEAVSQQKLTALQKQITDFQELLKDFTNAAEKKHDALDNKLEKRIVEVDAKLKEVHERIERNGREIDAKFAAYGAFERLFSERLAEERQFLVENYMKREDIMMMETRQQKGQDDIFKHFDKLEKKLDHYIEQIGLQRSESRRAT